jgi:hypothetical protein
VFRKHFAGVRDGFRVFRKKFAGVRVACTVRIVIFSVFFIHSSRRKGSVFFEIQNFLLPFRSGRPRNCSIRRVDVYQFLYAVNDGFYLLLQFPPAGSGLQDCPFAAREPDKEKQGQDMENAYPLPLRQQAVDKDIPRPYGMVNWRRTSVPIILRRFCF